jgi:hypothetical protein
MTVRAEQGHCPRCRKLTLLAPLYGDEGGPMTCVPCGLEMHDEIQDKVPRLFRKGIKKRASDERFLYLDVLEAAIRLTHPDKHPPERKDQAQQVTAQLLALKPYTLERPPPPSPEEEEKRAKAAAERSATMWQWERGKDAPKSELDFSHPCIYTTPYYYCDECRKRWEEGQQRRREAERQKQRAYRKVRRARELMRRPAMHCKVCETRISDGRKDAHFCSNACRQKAYRQRRAQP